MARSERLAQEELELWKAKEAQRKAEEEAAAALAAKKAAEEKAAAEAAVTGMKGAGGPCRGEDSRGSRTRWRFGLA